MKIRLNSLLIDKVGISASLLCAIHCAIVPLVITFLPIWGWSFLADDAVEVFMICLSLLLALISLSVNYRKHRRIEPTLVLLLGFALIGIGHFVESAESVIVPIGGITIAIAHILNIRLTKNCSIHSSLKKEI